MKVIKPPGVIMMSITVYQLSALIDITTYVTEAWSAQMTKSHEMLNVFWSLDS